VLQIDPNGAAVKRAFIIAALCMAGTSCATEGCIPATADDPELCPLKLPAITSVQIEHAGLKDASASGDPTDCSAFHLDEAQVRRYFAHARRVDEAGYHRLDWSPCSADGSVHFADGRVLRWKINLSKAGSLSARPDAPKTWQNLYCPQCTFAPFSPE
jgi:hypothetical protein